ncbi:MAG TPA: hypothetical protein VHE61_22925 [Opitutaceae bacterium]|nr:hypothetical protein [Opitutaceae bacterium]
MQIRPNRTKWIQQYWRLALLVAGVLFGQVALCAEEIVKLPKYAVSADVIAAMIPCDQLREIINVSQRYRDTFDLSEITFVKAPVARFARVPRCYIRAEDGHVLQEITNPALRFRMTSAWPHGFLSSNQPAEYAAFYFLLTPKLGAGPVTLGQTEKLMRAYTEFAESQLQNAIRHYGAAGAWCINLRWIMVPDEIDFVASSPAAAAAIGRRVQISSEGNLVRVSIERLADLNKQLRGEFVVANPGELAGVTPWRSTAGGPVLENHSTLLRIGRVEYRESAQTVRSDLIVVGLDPAPAAR